MIKRSFPKIMLLSAGFFLCISFFTISAQALTQDQVDSVLKLLESFDVDKETVTNVEDALTGENTATTSHKTFSRDLSVGSTGPEVKRLQEWLNKNGYTVARSGSGSTGNESTYYGERTKQAVAAYQAVNGISPTAGYFGPKTRGFINRELKEMEEHKDESKETSGKLIQIVSTDKYEYEADEKILITVELKNPTEEDVTLKFNSGCQFDYEIGDYRLMDNNFCTQALTEVSVPAGGKHVWEAHHNLSENSLDPGSYKITAGVIEGVEILPEYFELKSKDDVTLEILSEEPSNKGNEEEKAFIECLKEAEVVIYGTPTCPFCDQLVESFGGYDAVSPIYVNCQESFDRCKDEMQTSGVPEIQINGELYQ
ncbi:MAG: peptidoglycan-binding protein, partial [Patescibacteria group bacterium]